MRSPSVVLDSLAFFASCVQLGLAWIALFVVAHDLYRRRAALDRTDTVLALALFASAVCLRWFVPVHTLVHENHHGYDFDPALPLADNVFFNQVFSSRILLYKLYSYLRPFSREALFEHSVVLSSLGVAGAFLLARALHPSRTVAVCVSVLLLTQPLAILMAATEETLVLACGGGLFALALLAWGTRTATVSLLVAGGSLFAFSACARELTLLLSPLVPLVVVAALPDRTARTFTRAAITVGLTAVSLVPFALHVHDVATANTGSTSLVAVPHLPFSSHGLDTMWQGWNAPYVPRWFAWLSIAGFVACAPYAFRVRSERRFAFAALGLVIVCTVEGGLVASGWFPSSLRHQLFAMAALTCPAGWLVATVIDALARVSRRPLAVTVAGCGVLLTAGVATLVRAPAGARFDAPLAREYAFFANALATLPAQSRIVVFTRDQSHTVDHLGLGFLHAQRPAWQTIPAAELAQVHDESDPRPVVLLLDRTCFVSRTCLVSRHPDSCVPAPDDFEPSPYGRMAPYCREALRALPWREVSRLSVSYPGRPYDLPSGDPTVSLAALVFTR